MNNIYMYNSCTIVYRIPSTTTRSFLWSLTSIITSKYDSKQTYNYNINIHHVHINIIIIKIYILSCTTLLLPWIHMCTSIIYITGLKQFMFVSISVCDSNRRECLQYKRFISTTTIYYNIQCIIIIYMESDVNGISSGRSNLENDEMTNVSKLYIGKCS